MKAVVKLFKVRKIGAKLIFFLSNIDSPYHRCISDAGSRRAVSGEIFKKYLEEGGVVCIFFLSFFLLAVEREIETKAQTSRFDIEAYYRNKTKTF